MHLRLQALLIASLHGVMTLVDFSLSSEVCIGSVNRALEKLLSPFFLPSSVGYNYRN